MAGVNLMDDQGSYKGAASPALETEKAYPGFSVCLSICKG
jgi:hypothetical protein